MPSKRSKAQAAALALALSALVAACGSGSSSSSRSSSSSSSPGSSSASAGQSTATAGVAPAGKLSVAISGYAFHPAAITVAAGTKLTFTNHDQTAHTATSQQTAFDTGTVNPGRSAIVTLKKPGTYAYYCQFHAFMHGTLVVK